MTQPTNPDYHWTPANMRAFLEALAETGLVGEACDAAGKSRRAAYNLRFRPEGRAFAFGWEAALLVARAALADTLMERAIAGYKVTTVRDPDTHTSTAERFDTRGGMRLLERLDRMTGLGTAPEAGSDAALARIVAQDFWRFLDLVEAGGQGAETALFLAARTPPDGARAEDENAPDCELADEDGDPDPDLTRKVDRPEEAAARLCVRFSDYHDMLVTDFPPPEGFDGFESETFGDEGYCRALTAEEAETHERILARDLAPFRAAADAARERWLALGRAAADDGGEADVAA